MKLGIIGCGYIADLYLQTIPTYPELEIVGVTDRNAERANHFSAFYKLPLFASTEKLLSDANVEMVLNLTNPSSHFEVSKAALEAGKHVYSEKPVATDFSEAQQLIGMAKARNLQFSAAPCSVLGECAQTLWKALRENRVGQIRAVYAEMDDGPVHRMPYKSWLSASGTPWPFVNEFEVGCTIEHAGYSLSWLAAFFGPAQTVSAFSSLQIPDKGIETTAKELAPDLSVATIQFASGVVARLTCSTIAPVDHSLRIIGDDGVLYTPDVWPYTSPVYSRKWTTIRRKMFLNPWPTRYRRLSQQGRKILPDDRARGVAELALAITEGRPSRISADFSLHITELTLAISGAGNGQSYRMTTSFDPISPMPWAQ